MKKLQKLVASLLFTSMFLAGCAGGADTKDPVDENPTETPVEEPGEEGVLPNYTAEKPLTIKYWNFPNFVGDPELSKDDYDLALIKAFEDKYPNIKVEYQAIEFTDGPAKLETAIQSRTNPDV